MRPLEIRAYHAAGHAVIARSLGLVVTRVLIVSTDPAGGIVDGGRTESDLDASRRQLGRIDIDEQRAQTFIAGSIAHVCLEHRDFVNVLMSDGIGDFVILLPLAPLYSVSRTVIDAASYIVEHGSVLTPVLKQAWDTCASWTEESDWLLSLHMRVSKLVDAHWSAIEQEARRLIDEVQAEFSASRAVEAEIVSPR